MNCIFCGNESTESRDGLKNQFSVDCENCGTYQITGDAKDDFPGEIKRGKIKPHIWSGYIRYCTEKKIQAPIISNDNIKTYINFDVVPKDASEKLLHFLKMLNGMTEWLGQKFRFEYSETSWFYAIHAEEKDALIAELLAQGFVESDGHYDNGQNLTLTLRGTRVANEAENSNSLYKQAFVAMWFDDEMISIYRDNIKDAAKRAGYESLIIIDKEHLNEVTSEIIAEIKQSKFLIADLTGNRAGVYFEAGFAYGLGIPVIWTCRKDYFKPENIHFDVNHFPFIVWETGEDLGKGLYDRIRETM